MVNSSPFSTRSAVTFHRCSDAGTALGRQDQPGRRLAISCATVVIVDHPYIVRAGSGGEFTLTDVPVGPVTLIVVFRASEKESTSLVRRVTARVEASETTVVHIDLSTPEVGEERL